MALPVLNNPSLLTCLKKPLLVENTFLAANVTGSLLECPTTGKEQCRWESGAQPELIAARGKLQLSRPGWPACKS